MPRRRVSPTDCVMHLDGTERRAPAGAKYEIQIPDSYGRSRIEGYVGDDELELTVAGRRIPLAVLEAARRLPVGYHDLLAADGSPWESPVLEQYLLGIFRRSLSQRWKAHESGTRTARGREVESARHASQGACRMGRRSELAFGPTPMDVD